MKNRKRKLTDELKAAEGCACLIMSALIMMALILTVMTTIFVISTIGWWNGLVLSCILMVIGGLMWIAGALF